MSGTRLRGDRVDPMGAKDPQAIKDHLIDKLIEENRSLLAAIAASKGIDEEERTKIRRDAGLVMSRLVQDNAWYRKENEALSRRLSTADLQETKARQQLSELIKERQGVEQERRALQRYLETLREDKIDMEYQSKHLGAAFLTLRDSVFELLMNPVALEAEMADSSWESRLHSQQFQSAVIETVQITSRLRATVEAIDQRLIGLRLLEASATLERPPGRQVGTLQLMGERLVPEKELIQIRKERQLWQRRYTKCQEEIARGKVEIEQLNKAMEQKELLLKKAIAQKAVNRTTEGLRSALRAHNSKLQEEVKRLTETLSQSQRQLDVARQTTRQLKTRAASTPPPSIAPVVASPESFFGSVPSRTQTFSSKVASQQFLGTEAPPKRRGPGVSVQRIGLGDAELPRTPDRPKDVDERSVTSVRTMRTLRAPTKTAPTPAPTDIRDDVSVFSMRSARTLRSPSKPTLSPAPSLPRVIAPQLEAKASGSRAPSVAGSVKSTPSSAAFFGSEQPSRRGIGTTISQSDYQSPLAREIAALEKVREAEARASSAAAELQFNVKPASPLAKSASPVLLEDMPPIESVRPFPPIEPVRTSPPIESVRPFPPIEPVRTSSPIESVLPTSPVAESTSVKTPESSSALQVQERTEEKTEAIEKRASAIDFLAVSPPMETTKKIGIGQRKSKAVATERSPDIGRQRSGIGVTLRAQKRPQDSEASGKDKMRSFLSPVGDHKATPPYSTPRLHDEVFDDNSDGDTLLDDPDDMVESHVSDVTSHIKMILRTDTLEDSPVMRLHSSDLSSVLHILESLPSAPEVT